MTTKAQQYAATYFEAAWQVYKEYNIHPLATLAQGAFESAYGSSTIAQKNNHFGITKGSWTGPTYQSTTSGLLFRVYVSVADSFRDFGRLISKSYANCAAVSSNLEAYATAISQSRYISESNGDNRSVYRSSLITIGTDMRATVEGMIKKKRT